jgi:hypothetical protein
MPNTFQLKHLRHQNNYAPIPRSSLLDSGASCHISPFRHRFITYRETTPRPIFAADKGVFYATGEGDLQVDIPNGDKITPVILKNTLYSPDIRLTLISINRIARAGKIVSFEWDDCFIKHRNGEVVGRIPATVNGLYKIEHSHVSAATIVQERVSILTLHKRLGHISLEYIRALLRNNAVQGLQVIDEGSPYLCDSCEYAKTTRKHINKERQAPKAKNFGDEIHSDVWGPSPILSLGNRSYYVTFTDDATRWTRLYPLRTKDEAYDAYVSFSAWAKTQYGVVIKRFRSDRGGEFTSNQFTKYLQEQGTERRLTTHDTPEHNGVAEALNRRLLERVRAMLHAAQLPKNLWAEAIQHAVWLKNRTSTKALGNSTPYEQLTGNKPNLANIPEWGQHTWVHNATGSKLDSRAFEAHWVGHDIDSPHAHRIYWANKHKISIERNIKLTPPTATVDISRPRAVMQPPIPPAVAPPGQHPQPPGQYPPPPQPQTPQQQYPEATIRLPDSDEESEVEQQLQGSPPSQPAGPSGPTYMTPTQASKKKTTIKIPPAS